MLKMAGPDLTDALPNMHGTQNQRPSAFSDLELQILYNMCNRLAAISLTVHGSAA